MDWSTIFLLFLMTGIAETAREVYGTAWGRHFTRMVPIRRQDIPRDFWTERRSKGELRRHRRRWHIDLLSRTKIKELKK